MASRRQGMQADSIVRALTSGAQVAEIVHAGWDLQAPHHATGRGGRVPGGAAAPFPRCCKHAKSLTVALALPMHFRVAGSHREEP